MKKEYLKLDKVEGPLIVLSNVDGVAYDEIVHIKLDNGELRKGKVIKIEGKTVVVQVFEGTTGISTANASVKFTGEPLKLPLSKDILGRSFNGIGEPIDGAYPIISKDKYNVNGRPINPVARRYPRNFIQTTPPRSRVRQREANHPPARRRRYTSPAIAAGQQWQGQFRPWQYHPAWSALYR